MYRLEIKIDGLPKTTNSNKGHWTMRKKEADKWKRRVHAMVLVSDVGYPPEPLKKAKLTCIRYSSGKIDFDGLVSSFKHCIDGLIRCGVIADDKMENIGSPEYAHVKHERGGGHIKMIVEEVA